VSRPEGSIRGRLAAVEEMLELRRRIVEDPNLRVGSWF
jgi:hypothetical protein